MTGVDRASYLEVKLRADDHCSIFFLRHECAATLANEVITTHGVVSAKAPDGDGVRFTVDVWCDNEAGEKKTTGLVEVTVGARAPRIVV